MTLPTLDCIDDDTYAVTWDGRDVGLLYRLTPAGRLWRLLWSGGTDTLQHTSYHLTPTHAQRTAATLAATTRRDALLAKLNDPAAVAAARAAVAAADNR